MLILIPHRYIDRKRVTFVLCTNTEFLDIKDVGRLADHPKVAAFRKSHHNSLIAFVIRQYLRYLNPNNK